MKSPVDVSIIIVNYNTKDIVLSCLTSIKAAEKKGNSWEIIVVDNASADGSVATIRKKFKDVKVLAQKQNLGFSAGNNVGIRASQGRYILLLNSDTRLDTDTLAYMTTYMDNHTDVGVATCKLVLPNGSIDPACHRGFPTPWAALTYFAGLERLFPHMAFFSGYHQWYKDMTSAHEIDSPSGAFFFVRRSVIDEVGLLDEAFFMYGEDLDLAYRIRKKGWKIVYVPDVSILHIKKQSGRAHVNVAVRQKTQKYFYDTMALFYNKHYRHIYPWIVTQFVLLGIKVRSSL